MAGQRQEVVGALLRQWLIGARLRAAQRRDLGVYDNIDTVAHALNAFESLVQFLLLWDGSAGQTPFRCPGALLFLDEFELSWNYRRDRRDQFLQTLRALVDACQSGLFLCVGMATGMGVFLSEVESAYPALFQRLKGAQAVPTLVQIGGVVEAIGYAQAFLDYGREQASHRGVAQAKEDLLTHAEIEVLFKQVAPTGSASQGDFFDRIHQEVERKAASRGAAPQGSPAPRGLKAGSS
jgi:hypothetical protein